MEFRILELFSGIGGMHYAFDSAHLPGKVVAAMDINTIANAVYAFNHSTTKVHNNNIQSLTPTAVEKFGVNMILMSPPCQPHTRVGHRLDIGDHRSDALQHICALIPQCPGLEYILMENVKGFETSEARKNFIASLEISEFYWREFILTPTQFGIPNTRHRYFCIARKSKDFSFPCKDVWEEIPNGHQSHDERQIATIREYLETDTEEFKESYLPDKVLNRRVWLMDIVTTDACNTMCFTKAYTHYSEGTGSVLTSLQKEEMDEIFKLLKNSENQDVVAESRMALLRSLHLRYFTPREIARLMSFPETFEFPTDVTNRQKYRLLGNSINVHVVCELIKLMCS